MVVDANGDADYPVILTHIQQRCLNPQLDPTQQKDSMVHILSHEGPAKGIPVFRVHQIPDESAFVAQHRANLPAATFVAQPAQGPPQGSGRGARGARGSGTASKSRGAAPAGRSRGARGVSPAARGGRSVAPATRGGRGAAKRTST
ncbi:uncharacterized protein LOC125541053 [Triticum urartu]|uniref:uncharacterized protein LOC125541053 n=1 Tax=Triticum urartu TaxID=4572 RepID=UPI00204374C7|nr:uncharacterized protein LOC125541053 [Triticum urartu]